MFQKATKTLARLRLALVGPSGSGKMPDVNYFAPLTTTTLPHRLSLPTAHSE